MPRMTDYRIIVVGTDGSGLAEPTVTRAAWLAKREDADLVIVCAYSGLSRRDEAKNVATAGGDVRVDEVLGRAAASEAMNRAVAVAAEEGATVAAALLLEGEPAAALIKTARDRKAELLVVGARHDRSLTERLLGTVATEVTKRATCDVLIVRPPKA
ncbi:nucleotide-binding universal stress UspA family protein [Amaricoccus macauensis]|uniref:Nucleotide-binding universal stress UspA family protein n=1 Tax=Amaricoccus macauensis TaxID=57001 RepID=A0A840SLU1_9RHOB|nr:universal stress protein [Amaricoccus macauensis]MBB5220331.1 nucleotide-binding universal stress UspA family protein [Amaricoccus macauensis]